MAKFPCKLEVRCGQDLLGEMQYFFEDLYGKDLEYLSSEDVKSMVNIFLVILTQLTVAVL